MKTFRLIGMALLAVCANFMACSSDDDEITKDDDGVITNQKKLVEMKMTTNSETVTSELSYDTKGRLVSITHTEKYGSNTDRDITNITWGENTVTESENGESLTYSLTDGLIRTGSDTDGKDYSFVYNSSKQLTTYQYGRKNDLNTRTLTWDNGKITKIVYSDNHDDDEISEITYGNQTCKGYFPLMVLMVEDDFKLMIAHPELVGMRYTQLPSQITDKSDNREYKEEYTYKLDKDGYVESCTIKETSIKNGNTKTYTTNYTFKWE